MRQPTISSRAIDLGARIHMLMKLRIRPLILSICASALLFASSIQGRCALAQPQSTLGLQLYAGIQISGVQGSTYAVEFTAELGGKGSNNWHCLEFLPLPVDSYLWVDKTTPAVGRRYYRTTSYPTPTTRIP